MDGGIRRGSDILKAIALGAKAVGIGRPTLYGMARSSQAMRGAVVMAVGGGGVVVDVVDEDDGDDDGDVVFGFCCWC